VLTPSTDVDMRSPIRVFLYHVFRLTSEASSHGGENVFWYQSLVITLRERTVSRVDRPLSYELKIERQPARCVHIHAGNITDTITDFA
jgi:hypothetical protein